MRKEFFMDLLPPVASWYLFRTLLAGLSISSPLEENGGLLFENFSIFVFADCKIVESCCPGSGPVENWPGVLRHKDTDIIQVCIYSGYVKKHGLKVLTIAWPNGLIGALDSPVGARENDIGMLNLSNMDQELILLQPDVMEVRANGKVMLYYSIYGDSIFPLLNALLVGTVNHY